MTDRIQDNEVQSDGKNKNNLQRYYRERAKSAKMKETIKKLRAKVGELEESNRDYRQAYYNARAKGLAR